MNKKFLGWFSIRLAVFAPLLVAGCAGQLTNPDDFFNTATGGGSSTSSTGTGSGIDPCMAALVVATGKGCATLAGCHSDTMPSANLVLSPTAVGSGATMFVDKSNAGSTLACAAGMAKLIDSQQPMNSLIYEKVMGTSMCGVKMPVLGMLTSDDTTCVMNWINSAIKAKGGGSTSTTGAGGSTGDG